MGIISSIGIFLMVMLTITMAWLIPARIRWNTIIRRSRLLLATGTTILMVFFIVERILTMAMKFSLDSDLFILVCLIFILPAQYFFNLSVINILRQGRLTVTDIALGPIIYLLIMFTIGAVYYVTDTTMGTADPHIVDLTQYISAVLFAITIIYYNVQEVILIRRGRLQPADHALINQDRRMLFYATAGLIAIAFLNPLLIFIPVLEIHLVYWLLIFTGMYFCVVGSYGTVSLHYGLKEGSERAVAAAETQAAEPTMPPVEQQRVERAVRRWVERRRYAAAGLSLQGVADDMGVPRTLLTEWLRTVKDTYFSKWLTALRIQEAQRLMKAHPDWDNGQIAEATGFSSRSYFQRCFHDVIGMTPSEWRTQG